MDREIEMKIRARRVWILQAVRPLAIIVSKVNVWWAMKLMAHAGRFVVVEYHTDLTGWQPVELEDLGIRIVEDS